MSDDYAAGIEAAAQVVETTLGFPTPAEVATAIRALAPERGGGSEKIPMPGASRMQVAAVMLQHGSPEQQAEALEFVSRSPAPPAAPSGWRDIASAPRDGTVVWLYEPHSMGGFMFAGGRRKDGSWANNLDLAEQNPTHWQPLPAPPGAAPPPPVPAQADDRAEYQRILKEFKNSPEPKKPPVPAQAESGEVGHDTTSMPQSEVQGALNLIAGRIRELEAAGQSVVARQITEMKRANAAEARIRELEGEVARLVEQSVQYHRDLLDTEARADRLTTAAQAARDALERFDNALADASEGDEPNSRDLWETPVAMALTFGDLRRAREALATLASVLDGGEG